ncbi:MAG: insulinase family protein [Lachnospiraceae bacterium]
MNLGTYEILETRNLPDFKSEGTLLRHKKTGAKIMLLENDDDNKVFFIGFRTPPKDSTGVAHIVEHTVLCGSELFPLKDPFIELAKGSLNTFLNAMTYPEKTVYPVASCNEKDFQNLMHVYLDAVFHPNIYKEEKIFRQEGWHYELMSEEDELTINGVVYNEMKGAFSSPDDVLCRELFNKLYPDTAYAVESGGDPDVIPELTYEDYLDFHRTYYHPSNCYIYLYGNCDMEDKLRFIDEQYLSRYDMLSVDSFPGRQKPFAETRYEEIHYPITEEESTEHNTYLTYNVVPGDINEADLTLAFGVLSYALINAQGAPLRQALLDRGIGTDIYSTVENGILQPYFSIVAKNADSNMRELFVETIESTLKNIVKDGIDKVALESSLNSLEFAYREQDFGSNPNGLLLGLSLLDSWILDADNPFHAAEKNLLFAAMREKISTNYFEQLINDKILANTHKLVLIATPVRGLTAQKEKKLAQKLSAYKASLSEEEIADLVRESRELKEYQDAPEDPEKKKCLPMLSIEDLGKKVRPIHNKLSEVQGIKILRHDIFTNGIAHIRMLFRIPKLPKEYYPYLNLYKNLLGSIGTKHYTHEQLGYEINLRTGAFVFQCSNYSKYDDIDDYKQFFSLNTKCFYDNIKDVFELAKEVILTSRLDDEKRLKEMIGELKSDLQSTMMGSAHSVAMIRAFSYLSLNGAENEERAGVPYYRFLEDAEEHFELRKETIVRHMKELMTLLFRPENLMFEYTGEEEGFENICRFIPDFCSSLEEGITGDMEEIKRSFTALPKVESRKKNEGLTFSSQVQYVCQVGNFRKAGLPYHGSLRVLRTILGYDYLWMNVRVKGGAYGCMNDFARNGQSYIVSYRDPNLKETFDIYRDIADFVRNFQADEDAMTQYIIGTIASMDQPISASLEGNRSGAFYFSEITEDILMQERKQVLETTASDIQNLAPYMEAILKENAYCVVGNDDKVKNNRELFGEIIPLFH